jgi:hypothetical protein
MRTFVLTLALVLATGALVQVPAPTVWTFETDTVGGTPRAMSFSLAGNRGKAGVWKVEPGDDKQKNILVQSGNDPLSARFPVAVADAPVVADLDLSVRYLPISGKVDMAAGLVWRWQNADNYYIVRANALEDNVVLYKVENGKRTDLPLRDKGRTYGTKTPVPKNQWSTLRVVAKGDLFTVYNNGTELFQVEDTTFRAPGRIGVWTKADSVTAFDDLTLAVPN